MGITLIFSRTFMPISLTTTGDYVLAENSQIESSFAEIRKRNGRTSKFDQNKITNAIYKALMATNKGDRSLAEQLANGVLEKLASQGFSTTNAPSVEDIQDMVESVSYTHLTLPTTPYV